MTGSEDPIGALEALLTKIGAAPEFVRKRVARSYLYDVDYHVAMIACAFALRSAVGEVHKRPLLRGWLKLLQFVAARPRLAPDLVRWANSRRQQDFETWSKMPRGYVGDQTHEAVVDMLVANGTLVEHGDHLLLGPHASLLERVFESVCAENLFATEREVMERVRDLRVNTTMLEGQ